uniref:Serine/threonine-protein phosphatase n=1 Tax=Rhizophora mucronata TaxID=61149 RepID=A0A2P2MMM9_RHIMU
MKTPIISQRIVPLRIPITTRCFYRRKRKTKGTTIKIKETKCKRFHQSYISGSCIGRPAASTCRSSRTISKTIKFGKPQQLISVLFTTNINHSHINIS